MIILSLFTRGHTVGGEPEPIDHRFEPRFGMENVPEGWSPRNAYTRAKCFSLLSSRHCLLAGIRWAGGQSPSTTLPNRSSARTTSSKDDVRGMPTREHRMRCTTGGRGPEPIDHRPERSSAPNTSQRVRKTAGCRQRSLRRIINHRFHPLL